MYSNAPLASAVGSQNKFVRPMYPMKPASSDSVRGREGRGEGEEEGEGERGRGEGEEDLDVVLGYPPPLCVGMALGDTLVICS